MRLIASLEQLTTTHGAAVDRKSNTSVRYHPFWSLSYPARRSDSTTTSPSAQNLIFNFPDLNPEAKAIWRFLLRGQSRQCEQHAKSRQCQGPWLHENIYAAASCRQSNSAAASMQASFFRVDGCKQPTSNSTWAATSSHLGSMTRYGSPENNNIASLVSETERQRRPRHPIPMPKVIMYLFS